MLLRSLALQSDKGACVTGRDGACSHGGLPRRAATEQPERLGHGPAVLPDSLRDLTVREVELFGEALETAGFFDGVEVRALEVLDEAQDKLGVIAGVAAHYRGHGTDARKPCRTPSPLACDQLVAVSAPAHQEWLQHAVLADRFRELPQRFGVKARPHLLMRGPDLVDRAHLGDPRLASA